MFIKHARAMTTGLLVAMSLVACDKQPIDPIEQTEDPQLNLSPDSVTLGVFTHVSLNAALFNASGQVEYISRDQIVATVNANGAISALGVGTTYIVATLAGRSDVRDSVRVRVHADSCSGARPDLGGAATEADRARFSYDLNAPLNLQKTIVDTFNGIEVSNITYSSPDGGLVTGMMWEPLNRTGLRPGIILMHGHPGTASQMAGLGLNYAQHGAVVIAIDAPFSRRATGPKAMTWTPLDGFEQIQVIKDLQRAVDILRSHPKVDDNRIAYVGFSWGGATGALFVGIERRLKAAALVVGHPGQVTHATGPDGFKNIMGLSCGVRAAWMRAMAPVEPIRYVGNANVPLLLQNGTSDQYIPSYEAAELHAAAPQPKTVEWYEAGHNLTQASVINRYNWLVEHIGLEPLQ